MLWQIFIKNKLKKTIEWPKWPQYGPEEQAAVVRVIKSNQLFADREVRNFEEQYASYIGCKYAISVSSCTAGLQLALFNFGIGKGDEVITVPNSDLPTAMTISHVGAKIVGMLFEKIGEKVEYIEGKIFVHAASFLLTNKLPIFFASR